MRMACRIALAGLASWLVAAGCSDAPVAFSQGTRIPLGRYGVTVTHLEAREESGSATDDGKRGTRSAPIELAVYVTLDGPLTLHDAREFERVTGAGRATLVDVRNHRFHARGRWSAELYGNLPRHGVLHHRLSPGELDAQERRQRSLVQGLDGIVRNGFPDRCVYVFEVPGDDYGFTLELSNGDPRPGQPRRAAVDLGR